MDNAEFVYCVVKGKIAPAFRNGNVFGKRQFMGTFDEQMADFHYNALVKDDEACAVYKIKYNTDLSQLVHIELIKYHQ
jgi:hypothetical protein